MKKTAKSAITARFSPRACLAAIGTKLRALDLLAPVKAKLRIDQKTIKHAPLEKLEDALITILAGAHGLSEINTRLRSRARPPNLPFMLFRLRPNDHLQRGGGSPST
jgi:hypothetical protein